MASHATLSIAAVSVLTVGGGRGVQTDVTSEAGPQKTGFWTFWAVEKSEQKA